MHFLSLFKLIFILLLGTISFYIVMIKTEKYTSSSTVIIKDLSQKQSQNLFGSMLLGQSSSAMQDSKLLELYIHSSEMFTFLDKEHNLSQYYSSPEIDFVQRLEVDTWFNALNRENILAKYRGDISVHYDAPSTTLNIRYLHANPEEAQKIVRNIISFASAALNRFEQENTSVVLKSLRGQDRENKKIFTASLKKLIAYQNEHNSIDPNLEVQAKSSILANLESELVQKEVEYKSKLAYMNKNTAQMKLLKNNIQNIRQGISKIKYQITGKGRDELNKDVSGFELLKSEVDFNKEKYKQTLIQLEESKASVKQNSKNLIVITQPTLASTYAEPKKLKELLTLLIILSFFYGIIVLIMSILKDHKD